MAIIYLAAAHVFDGVYGFVSAKYNYLDAMSIMFFILTIVSVIAVLSHAWVKERFGWDILELDELNHLGDLQYITPSEKWKRFKRWIMRRRLIGIFLCGSIVIGPPVVTVLLRKPKSLADNIFYIFSGTLLSVVFWVTSWKGFWTTWDLCIIPAIHKWIA